jgi:fibrillarin-like rRNA methylase
MVTFVVEDVEVIVQDVAAQQRMKMVKIPTRL